MNVLDPGVQAKPAPPTRRAGAAVAVAVAVAVAGSVSSLSSCCVALLVTFPFEFLLFKSPQGNEMQNQDPYFCSHLIS